MSSSRSEYSAAVEAATTPRGAMDDRKARWRPETSPTPSVAAATAIGRTTIARTAARRSPPRKWSPRAPASTPAARTMNSPPMSRATTGSPKARSCAIGTHRWLASARPSTVVANSPASDRTASASV